MRATGGFPGEELQFEWLHDEAILHTASAHLSRAGDVYTLRISDTTGESAGKYEVRVWCESQSEKLCSQSTTLIVTGLGVMEEAMRIVAEKGDSLTDDSATMVVHDFAGQRMYYVLHQILLTVALTRYVVGVSLEHDLDEPLTDPEDRAFGMTHRQNLEFWLIRSTRVRRPHQLRSSARRRISLTQTSKEHAFRL